MIKVWGRRNSINVQKVLWALGEAGIEFERITLGGSFGGNDKPEYRKLNPTGLVPTLEDGTIRFFESNAIVRYLARRYGKGTLQPRGFRALALAEQWVELTTSTIAPSIMPIFINKVRLPPESADLEAAKRAEKPAGNAFRMANRLLGRKPFVAGRSFSYGDIPLGAVYWRYKNLEIERPSLPNLDRWFEALQERPAYREWIMIPIGRNFSEWNANEQKLK
jgi:glutathione S-transferase